MIIKIWLAGSNGIYASAYNSNGSKLISKRNKYIHVRKLSLVFFVFPSYVKFYFVSLNEKLRYKKKITCRNSGEYIFENITGNIIEIVGPY